MICKQHPLWNLHVEAFSARQVVHQREIRRPLETFCAESDRPVVAKRDHKAVVNPDLQMGEGGGVVGGHPGPEMRGGGVLFSKNFFQPFGPQFGLKIGGGRGRPFSWMCLAKDWCDVTQCQGLQD